METKFITLEGLRRFKELLDQTYGGAVDYEAVSKVEIRDFVFDNEFATDAEVDTLLNEIFGNDFTDAEVNELPNGNSGDNFATDKEVNDLLNGIFGE